MLEFSDIAVSNMLTLELVPKASQPTEQRHRSLIPLRVSETDGGTSRRMVVSVSLKRS